MYPLKNTVPEKKLKMCKKIPGPKATENMLFLSFYHFMALGVRLVEKSRVQITARVQAGFRSAWS